MAVLLANFRKVYQSLKKKKAILILFNTPYTGNTFCFSEVSENDTLKLLCGLKEAKADGPDKINAKLVKDSTEVICPTLTKIFNRSLQQSIFPKELKTVLSPLFTKTVTNLTVTIIDLFRFCRLLQKF